MQATLDLPTTNLFAVSEATAQQTANAYLSRVLGADYRAANGFYGQGRWYFLIRCQPDHQTEPYNGGKLMVDALRGAVLALSEEQICEIRESVAVQAAQRRGELARDAQGYVLRYQAQQHATQWLRDHLTMHFGAVDGFFVPLEHPLWQFSIRFTLPHLGEIQPLGVLDVDAQSGQVKPLSRQQQQTIQERVREIIRHRELATAA